MLAPAMPASGEPMLNPFSVAVTIYLNEGLVRNVFIDAVSTGLTFGTFYLPAGKTITIVYDQAPAWNWLSA
jgi:hypothetical protein